MVEGCFKTYSIDDSGTEHNLSFTAENDWIADIESLHNENPSAVFIEALEPSTILQISKGDLHFLYNNYPKFDRNFRVVVENKYIQLQNRLLLNFSKSASERYEVFLTQFPNLSQQDSQYANCFLSWHHTGIFKQDPERTCLCA